MSRPTSHEEYLEIIKTIKNADDENWFAKDEPSLVGDEITLNDYMKRKRDELVGNKYTYDAYAPALMFHKSYEDILYNKLFTEVFCKMPCGGNLHIHTSSSFSTEGFLELLKNDPKVYVYWDPDAGLTKTDYFHGKFYYFTSKPTNTKFINLKEIAETEKYPYKEIKRLITFIDNRVEDIEYIWDGFNDYFTRVGSILKVRSIYKEYYIKSFEYQYENNNDYIELRAGISNLVDNNDGELKGNQVNTMVDPYTDEVPESISILYDAYDTARQKYPDLKVKLIISSSRRISKDKPEEDVDLVGYIISHIPAWQEKLKDSGTQFIIGYDLVSEEDINHKTDDYAEKIINTLNGMGGKEVNFYFHDGESNWADNDNVFGAYALGTKRVGHGINIYNFPQLMIEIQKANICLEICPISNQMLRYIQDLRIHPITEFMKRNIQCVVCSDDPQIFETAGTYYDLWEVYHGSFIDLRDLKKLIKNSYIYSGMSEVEKAEKLAIWEVKWQAFVSLVVAGLDE